MLGTVRRGSVSNSRIFYMGAQLNFLVSIDDFSTGAIFFGGNAIFGNPRSLAFGAGLEVSNAFDYTGTVILGGSLTAYMGGFDIRVFYGQDLGEEISVVMLAAEVTFKKLIL